MRTIDGKNYFNPISFNEACEALEQGKIISMYIDCIGHGTNNREQEIYKEYLLEKYGDNLQVEKSQGAVSYSYSYSLKNITGGGKNA